MVDLWLLSVTGLFLNHPKWRVNDYRANSQWIESTVSVRPATGEDPLEKANHYLRELGLEGELLGVRDVEREKQFRFDVYKPGNTAKVRIDLESGEAKIGTIASSDHWSTHISYAMVFTEQPTREAIFEAIHKRHTYAPGICIRWQGPRRKSMIGYRGRRETQPAN